MGIKGSTSLVAYCLICKLDHLLSGSPTPHVPASVLISNVDTFFNRRIIVGNLHTTHTVGVCGVEISHNVLSYL